MIFSRRATEFPKLSRRILQNFIPKTVALLISEVMCIIGRDGERGRNGEINKR